MGNETQAQQTKDLPRPVINNEVLDVPISALGAIDESEADDFGLPKRTSVRARARAPAESSDEDDGDTFQDAQESNGTAVGSRGATERAHPTQQTEQVQPSETPLNVFGPSGVQARISQTPTTSPAQVNGPSLQAVKCEQEAIAGVATPETTAPSAQETLDTAQEKSSTLAVNGISFAPSSSSEPENATSPTKPAKHRSGGPAVSEWSHQRLAPQTIDTGHESEEEESWQAMPALGEYDIYDDENRLVARGARVVDDEEATYGELGGAGKGYTRVQLDEDAQSATSMDDDTNYLFKEGQKNAVQEEEEQRDAEAQLEATKDLLTEGQRIAYVGVTRLTIYNMIKELEDVKATKPTKKDFIRALESMEMWGQQMMVRVYGHMDIDSAEQVMIEQLAEHGVQPADLVPPLMQNSRIKNPMADEPTPQATDRVSGVDAATGSTASTSDLASNDEAPPAYEVETSKDRSSCDPKQPSEPEVLPLYETQTGEQVPDVQPDFEIPHTAKIDLDLRWTVLCDLFLMLLSDSIYDARSRVLLERVASAMDISWVQICRFEKRVMDALEMQEREAKEQWSESDHMEKRRKLGLKRKYMYMGLATVGGGLVIGLSAGLLAPVIGAGLAAGFTTIGVSGTATFLGGVGGAALITSAATAAGGTVAVRASHRRTGAVKTFEYRPLHNNKRVNLILSVSGWMSGKVDDVRLPYSTVDPIMGDIYSLLWEPEMLQSMGDTINILATEALTQTVQQVLGMTILTALMAAIQLPVVLTKLSYLIDNPWSVSLDRANSAGQILADSLIDRHLGNRPITLLGFSLGSRLIFSCLNELAKRGAHGLVQNVYLFGSPIVANRDEYLRARSVISGRFVNGYASKDWILGYLFRATSGGIYKVAGLAPVEDIPGLENIDVTALVNGHMAYRAAMPRLLREVGWEVESDEFTEIEDPDPENHDKRQRELIREIDEARKEAEAKPEKRIFGFFKRGKVVEKKRWETYDASEKNGHKRNDSDPAPGFGFGDSGILFDIDAIRKELESEMIEVRELDSTLPPMQISMARNGMPERSQSAGSSASSAPRRETVLAQQGLDPAEIAKLKLPPRPDEIEDDHHPDTNGGDRTQMSFEPDLSFAMPRELKSTLPPLTLSPSIPQSSSGGTTPVVRPELKSHYTTPNLPSASERDSPAALSTPSFAALSLDRNAWADEDADFGQERNVKMTFE